MFNRCKDQFDLFPTWSDFVLSWNRLLQIQLVKGPSAAQLLHEHAAVLRNGDGLLPVRDAADGVPARPVPERQPPPRLGGQHHVPRPHRRREQMLAHPPNAAQRARHFLRALLRLLRSKHFHPAGQGCGVRHQPDACFR